jgi:hypothetical protein
MISVVLFCFVIYRSLRTETILPTRIPNGEFLNLCLSTDLLIWLSAEIKLKIQSTMRQSLPMSWQSNSILQPFPPLSGASIPETTATRVVANPAECTTHTGQLAIPFLIRLAVRCKRGKKVRATWSLRC